VLLQLLLLQTGSAPDELNELWLLLVLPLLLPLLPWPLLPPRPLGP
jgi:hypothetical protein